MSEAKRIDPIKRGCIMGLSPYDNCVCCGEKGVECCMQCTIPCNGRCGWIPEKGEEGRKRDVSKADQ